MNTCNISSVLMHNEELFNELYNAGVLLNATKCCCQDREFRGEYYGIPQSFIVNISNERNEYLSLLTMLSDKISQIYKLSHSIENELTLHHDTDYSGRKITTECPDY